MTASIKAGLRAAVRHPKLVWLLWAWYGLLALVPALPAWSWWNGVLGSSPEAASVLKRFDLGVFLDLTAGKGINGIGLLTGAAAAAGFVALVSSAFAFGGILEVFGTEDDQRSFMHRFFRGGGHFFWRFFRLAIMAGVCLVLATGAMSALMAAATAPMGKSEWEPAGYLGGVATMVVVLAVAALFLLALDYARIRVARDDSRSMLKAYASGLGFVLRRLFRFTASPFCSSRRWPRWPASTWRTRPTLRPQGPGRQLRCCSSSSRPSCSAGCSCAWRSSGPNGSSTSRPCRSPCCLPSLTPSLLHPLLQTPPAPADPEPERIPT